jgi:hypothetical protein
VLEKIIKRHPYVKRLETDKAAAELVSRAWKKKDEFLIMENERIREENKNLRSYLGYLVNENHLVAQDNHGKYIPMNPEKLNKYADTRPEIRQRPPLNTLLLYAEPDKEKRKE